MQIGRDCGTSCSASVLRGRTGLGTAHEDRGHGGDLSMQGHGRPVKGAWSEAFRHVCARFSLRLEKGYRAWKGDLSTDYSVLQGGLGTVRPIGAKDRLQGQARAWKREKQQGVSKQLRAPWLSMLADSDAPYMSTLWHNGQVVGETTSGGWGHRDRQVHCAWHVARRPERAWNRESKSRSTVKCFRAVVQSGRTAVGIRQEREDSVHEQAPITQERPVR